MDPVKVRQDSVDGWLQKPGPGKNCSNRFAWKAGPVARDDNNKDKILGVATEGYSPDAQTAVNSLLQEFERLKAELREKQDKVSELETVAAEDPLVPLLNRRGFLRELNRALAYARRYDAHMCVVFLDLDKFKDINDRFGHATGDVALKLAANTLLDNLRESDIVGRIGGDEFAVVLWNTDRNFAGIKAKSLVAAIADATLVTPKGRVPLSATAGVAAASKEDSAESVLERADAEMYAAKKR